MSGEQLEFEDAWGAWSAQCLKRGTRQDGERWQEDDAATGEGHWVPKMVPKPSDRTLPTREAVVRLEAAARRLGALEGMSVSQVLRRRAGRRVADVPTGDRL